MSNTLLQTLYQLSDQFRKSLSKTNYKPPDSANVSVKSTLLSLLHSISPNSDASESETRIKTRDFCLFCAALASSETTSSEHLMWIPSSLWIAANSAFREVARAYWSSFVGDDDFCVEFSALSLLDEKKLVIELMPEVLPLLKGRISESSIDKSNDGDEISAAMARAPVACAVVAAHQFRWFVTRVEYPDLGKMCALVIPGALTALDHWSPQVKGQGMITFIHLAKNVNAAELSLYEDVILDACCENIASSDEIWEYVVEMSVLLVTCTQQNNPRSPWYEKLLNEMLSHVERQPRNKERRNAWLKHITPLFNSLGLILLAHFRRIFPLFFQWMHADDDEAVLLVLDQVKLVIKLTWIRNSTYIGRLVDELAILYKEAALKVGREDIRNHVLQILILLQQCKSQQFEAAWDKHKNDPNLTTLCSSFIGNNPV